VSVYRAITRGFFCPTQRTQRSQKVA